MAKRYITEQTFCHYIRRSHDESPRRLDPWTMTFATGITLNMIQDHGGYMAFNDLAELKHEIWEACDPSNNEEVYKSIGGNTYTQLEVVALMLDAAERFFK